MGKENDKRVTFYYTDAGHAAFKRALKDHEISQSVFFRIVMEGVVDGEPYIESFIKRKKKVLQKKKLAAKRLQGKSRRSSKPRKDSMLYDAKELKNIFDLLEREGAIK